MEQTVSANTLVIRKDEASNEPIKLDYVAVKSAAMTLRAINHKLRQQIVRRLEQSVASQHLAILRRADIVITERDGKFIHYALNHARIASVAHFVKELINSEK